jgi:hypothetical protein
VSAQSGPDLRACEPSLVVAAAAQVGDERGIQGCAHQMLLHE